MAWLRVTDPRGRTRLEALEGDRSVLGRSTSCDIPVDDPDVGLRHVSVLRTERGYLIVAESDSLPIWKDDERVSNTFLEDGADYRIGSTTLRFLEQTTDGIAEEDLGSAATVMGEEAQPLPPRGQTLLGAPKPNRTPSSSPTMQGVAESKTEDGADTPDTVSTTRVQGSGTTADDADSTRTVSPGPPVPSSTPTLPGKAEAASKTEVARPRPRRAGTTPPWKTQPPLPRTGRTVVPSSTPAPPALQLVPHQRTAPPVPRPNPEGSTPTQPPTHPPIRRADVLDEPEAEPELEAESEPEPEPVEVAGSIEPPDAITVDLPIESATGPIELGEEDAPTDPRDESDAVPPVRFPPPPEDGSKSTHSWVWRKDNERPAKSRDSVYSMGSGPGEVHRSSESWGWNEGEAPGPEGRAELEPEVDLPPGGPKKGLEAPLRPQSPPPPAPPPPVEPVPVAEPSPPPRPEPTPEPPPAPKPQRPRVEPVLLPARRDDEPPLPAVSKELSSGHSWMWALPQSLRDGTDPARRSRGSDPLVVAGVVLLIIGAGLIGIAFAFGLTTDVIAEALGGGA